MAEEFLDGAQVAAACQEVCREGVTQRMLAQDFIYMALGAAFAMAFFARIISLLSDKGSTIINYLLLVAQAILAAVPLAYSFGFLTT